MDRQTARDLFLNSTNFRPKEKDLPTPYLTLPDGTTLDGQLKLVGLSGKQSMELEDEATEQAFDKEGNAINRVNPKKFAALAVQACVRMRETGEHLLNVADVLGERGDGNSELLEKDNDVFRPLVSEVLAFIGKKVSLKEKKDVSGSSQDDSDSTSLPPASDALSENSSIPSTPPS